MARSQARIGQSLMFDEAKIGDDYNAGYNNSLITGERPTALIVAVDEKRCAQDVLQKHRRPCSIELSSGHAVLVALVTMPNDSYGHDVV